MAGAKEAKNPPAAGGVATGWAPFRAAMARGDVRMARRELARLDPSRMTDAERAALEDWKSRLSPDWTAVLAAFVVLIVALLAGGVFLRR